MSHKDACSAQTTLQFNSRFRTRGRVLNTRKEILRRVYTDTTTVVRERIMSKAAASRKDLVEFLSTPPTSPRENPVILTSWINTII